MKVLYCRVSTIEQKTDRQRVDEKSYKLVIEDKCSGSIPFFERVSGVYSGESEPPDKERI